MPFSYYGWLYKQIEQLIHNILFVGEEIDQSIKQVSLFFCSVFIFL